MVGVVQAGINALHSHGRPVTIPVHMAWYDVFSNFYDRSLEPLYATQRVSAAEALDLRPGLTILDLPCGTGQSFDAISVRMAGGVLVGADLSTGMLRRATARAEHLSGDIRTMSADATAIDGPQLAATLDAEQVDRLHIFLGMTAFPDWRATFENLWARLTPGGRCVIVDVHTDQLGFQGHMVNWVAQADITRPVWEPLERLSQDFRREPLPSKPAHGGTLYLSTGVKPR